MFEAYPACLRLLTLGVSGQSSKIAGRRPVHGPSGAWRCAPLAAAIASIGCVMPVAAQAPATAAASAASAPSSSQISEAARRQAESPYRWILTNAKATGPAREAPAARPATDAGRAAAPAPAAAATRTAAAEQPAPAPSARTGGTNGGTGALDSGSGGVVLSPTPNVAPAPAPEPARVAAPPPPPPPPAPVAAPEPARRVELPLVAVSQESPNLPSAILRELSNETVRVRFTVQGDGSVANPSIISSTNRRLNTYILNAVQRWRYQPIGEPRAHEVELAFKLD
jgi:TonB family protein